MHTSPVIEVRQLRKYYRRTGGRLSAPPGDCVRAVDGVSFDLMPGELVALVGESGSGKSALLSVLMGLEQPTGGRIIFEGTDITGLAGKRLNTLRRRVQMVFQDPYASLNPTMTVGEIVAEPLMVHRLAPDGKERIARVCRTLEDVGLTPADAFLHRRPYELSGGQRQRVAIAAALVLDPTVLLADEPVSMLDVSVRAGILNLLNDLHRTRGLSILFVTHDVSTASAIADRVAVMYLGRIVEVGPCRAVLGSPVHPYTVALVSAVPVSNPRQRRSRTILQGDLPNSFDASDASDASGGCGFHPRCPVAFDLCRTQDPSSVEVGQGHRAACLRVGGGMAYELNFFSRKQTARE